MTKTEIKNWMWQWLSPYINQYKFMDKFDERLDKYIETKNVNLPTSDTVSDLLKEDEVRETFYAGFDEGYTNPLEKDGRTITEEEYKVERHRNYLQWLMNPTKIKNQTTKDMKQLSIYYAATTLNAPIDQAIQTMKSQLTGQPITVVIEGELMVVLDSDLKALQKENEELKAKLNIGYGQELFNALARVCDFNALETDMQEIINAVKRDNNL